MKKITADEKIIVELTLEQLNGLIDATDSLAYNADQVGSLSQHLFWGDIGDVLKVAMVKLEIQKSEVTK